MIPKNLKRTTREENMSDTDNLMNLISLNLGFALDEIYQRLLDCNFGFEDQELAMFNGSVRWQC